MAESMFKGLLRLLIAAWFLSPTLALVYNSTTLIIATNAETLDECAYLLNGYGIRHDELMVPSGGIDLPDLENDAGGNYGLIVVNAQVQYQGQSALTTDQWNTLYAYQLKYGVRMVNLDVVPSATFGVSSLGNCCNNNEEQNVTLVSEVMAKEFPTAGLKIASLSSLDLYHYPANITNTSTTQAYYMFAANSDFPSESVGGVINTFEDGREQMASFMAMGNWSMTTTYLGHAWVHWGYRGLYQGFRRVYLQTQVDDLLLQTAMYLTNDIFRIRSEDLAHHVDWTANLNTKLNNGSSYFTEFGFNGNGNLIYDYTADKNVTSFSCDNPVFTDWQEPAEDLEYIKPLGSGVSLWPATYSFHWTGECVFLDPLAAWLANTSNRDAIGLVTHTFTHLELDNATYHDAIREIHINLQFAELLNITNSPKFSASGLIPPAITGLHNGDVIRGWSDNGLWNAIGDNTRPILRNPHNYHWPQMTTMAVNGHDNYQITPRFATRIYYNCDRIDCDVQQWVDTENGTPNGTIFDLLELERVTVSNQLMSLFHDPYMFHQPNLRQIDVDPINLNGVEQKLSLLQMWLEVVTAQMVTLVEWPIITLKHDHIAMGFNQRMVLDSCNPYMQFITNSTSTNSTSITGFSVRANGDTCEVNIPITVPADVVDSKGFLKEQIGSDPSTIWVKLDGESVDFELSKELSI